MKKRLLIPIVIFMMGFITQHTFGACGDKVFPKLPSGQTINFNSSTIEDVWSLCQTYSLSTLTTGAATNNPGGQWRMMWDGTYFYFLIEINDTQRINTGGWEGDAVEIYLKRTDGAGQYGYSYNNAGNSTLYNKATGSANNDFRMWDVATTYNGTTGGYILKVRIPYTNVQLDGAGNTLAMELAVNQTNGSGRSGQLSTWTSAIDFHGSTNHYTNIILDDCAQIGLNGSINPSNQVSLTAYKFAEPNGLNYTWEKSIYNRGSKTWSSYSEVGVTSVNTFSEALSSGMIVRYRVTYNGKTSSSVEIRTAVDTKTIEDLCGTGGIIKTLFTYDFGTVNGRTNLNPLIDDYSKASVIKNLTYANAGYVNDGLYAVVNNAGDGALGWSDWGDGNWFISDGDHTGTNGATGNAVGGNGAMLLVNNANPGEVLYSRILQTPQAGILMEFSIWAANVVRNSGKMSANLDFFVWGYKGTGTTQADFQNASNWEFIGFNETGDLPYAGGTGNRLKWQKKQVLFNTSNYSYVRVEIQNNLPAGAGNDVVIDDIAFKACVPEIDLGLTKTQIKEGEQTKLTVEENPNKKLSDTFTNPYYVYVYKACPTGQCGTCGGAWKILSQGFNLKDYTFTAPNPMAADSTYAFNVFVSGDLTTTVSIANQWIADQNATINLAYSSPTDWQCCTATKTTKTDPPGVVDCTGNCSTGCTDGTCWPKTGTLATGGKFTQCQTTVSTVIQYEALITKKANTTYKFYSAATGSNEITTNLNFNLNTAFTKNIWVTATETGKLESDRVKIIITVNGTPTISAPSGNFSACLNTSTLQLSATPAGGTWTSGTTGVATIVNTTGVVTGAAVGTSTITYTSTTGCTATKDVAVNDCSQMTVAISSITPVCIGSTFSYTVTVTNGTTAATNVALKLGDGALGKPSDILDSHTGTPSAGSYATSTATWTIGSMAANATATLTISGTMKDVAAAKVNFSFRAFVNTVNANTYGTYGLAPNGFKALETATPGIALPTVIISADPKYGDRSRCGQGNVLMGVTATPAGASITWYSANTGGTVLGTGAEYTATNISATTTYYVEATTVVGGCSSVNPGRLAITATVKNMPGTIVVTPDSKCGPSTVNLTATAGATDAINWYSASTGGASLRTGTSYSPTINASTTYWVEATSNQGCSSLSRTSVTGTIVSKPEVSSTAGDERCGTGEVTLTAASLTSNADFIWYEDDGTTEVFQGNPLVTTISQTTTYKVVATKNGCMGDNKVSVTGTIKTVPTVAIAGNADDRKSCFGGGQVTLQATANQALIYWYESQTDAETPVNEVHIGTTYHPTISADPTTFWVRAEGTNGCWSDNVETVDAGFKAKPTTSITSTNAELTTCDTGGPVTLKASGTGDIYWYATEDNADNKVNSLYTGATYATNITVNPTTFYARLQDANGCWSDVVPATTIVKTKPTASISSTSAELTTCDTGGPVTLKASGTGNIYWYETLSDANNDVNSLYTGATYTTTISVNPSTFYARLKDTDGCWSDAVPATTLAKAKPTASISSSGNDLKTCDASGGAVTFRASGAGTIYWYETLSDANSNINSLYTGTPYATTISVAPTTYYAKLQDSEGCWSDPVPAITGFKTKPTVFITSTANQHSTCGDGQVYLEAGSDDPGATFKWYLLSDPTVLHEGNPYQPFITAPTTYEVEAIGSNGCPSAAKIPVDATFKVRANMQITDNGKEFCKAYGPFTLEAMPNNLSNYKWRYSEDGGITWSAYVQTQKAELKGENMPMNRIYEVSSNDPTVCVNPAQIQITLREHITGDMGLTKSKEEVAPGENVTFTVTPGYLDTPEYSFRWSENDVNSNENLINFYKNKSITVYVVDANKVCPEVSATTQVKVIWPTAITPYDIDGLNDDFLANAGFKMVIFNRYGQKVYEGRDGWDGTYRGKTADPGTYYYVVDLPDGDVQKGTIEVVKLK